MSSQVWRDLASHVSGLRDLGIIPTFTAFINLEGGSQTVLRRAISNCAQLVRRIFASQPISGLEDQENGL